jgi:hypothetical protein
MSFMQKQIYYSAYFEIDTTCGTEIVPDDCVGAKIRGGVMPEQLQDYLEGKPLNPYERIMRQNGWLARLSAPGYLDCTCWSAHKTEQEANDFLDDMYGEDDNG